MYSQANANLLLSESLVSIAVCQSELRKRQGSRDSGPSEGCRVTVGGSESRMTKSGDEMQVARG
jgi:hypothetical protein